MAEKSKRGGKNGAVKLKKSNTLGKNLYWMMKIKAVYALLSNVCFSNSFHKDRSNCLLKYRIASTQNGVLSSAQAWIDQGTNKLIYQIFLSKYYEPNSAQSKQAC